jgi:hypothetical protein
VPKTQKVPDAWLPPFNSTKMAIRFRTPEMDEVRQNREFVKDIY